MTDDDAVKRQHNAERMLNDPFLVIDLFYM